MLQVSANEQLVEEMSALVEQLAYWKEKAERLEQLSLTDELTQCGNRRKFDEDLVHQWNKALRENRNICIVYFDLDGLKSANDNYGHDCGDKFIVGAANAVKRYLRSYDELYRWGGDEFAMILLDIDLEQCKVIAERVRMAVCSIRNDDGLFFGSASVGVTSVNPVFSTPQELINNADLAQKKAKQSGKNQVSW